MNLIKGKALLLLTAVIVGIAVTLWLIFSIRLTDRDAQVLNKETALRQSAAPKIGDDLDAASLQQAIQESIDYLARLSENSTLHFGEVTISKDQLHETLASFSSALNKFGLSQAFFRYLEDNFLFFTPATETVLFTGYYEPELEGSRSYSTEFPVPLYSTPPDLIRINLSDFSSQPCFEGVSLRGRLTAENKLVPYFSRQEIDFNQVLNGQGLELFWVKDLIEHFFLQIQGSGIIKLADGTAARVNYAEKNGHAYKAIGRLLVERAVLTVEEASMDGIKAYLRAHPEQLEEILSYNQSYVFFREVEKGPIGSIGAVLTPGRSIATDQQLFPRGALALIVTEKPLLDENGTVLQWQPLRRFVLNQDTGGAIKGPGRVDLFTGSGEEAGRIAGVMRQAGNFYFLVKKDFQ